MTCAPERHRPKVACLHTSCPACCNLPRSGGSRRWLGALPPPAGSRRCSSAVRRSCGPPAHVSPSSRETLPGVQPAPPVLHFSSSRATNRTRLRSSMMRLCAFHGELDTQRTGRRSNIEPRPKNPPKNLHRPRRRALWCVLQETILAVVSKSVVILYDCMPPDMSLKALCVCLSWFPTRVPACVCLPLLRLLVTNTETDARKSGHKTTYHFIQKSLNSHLCTQCKAYAAAPSAATSGDTQAPPLHHPRCPPPHYHLPQACPESP